MSNNLLKNLDELKYFRNSKINFTISNRMLEKNMNIDTYIKTYYSFIDISQVESLFGFTQEFSPFYGGRGFNSVYSMDKEHLKQLDDDNLGLSLTLTNQYFNDDDYQKHISLLQKHHKLGNSIVCENDTLAKQIKKDFPLYKLKASLIKDLNNYEKVQKAFEIYDYVVIPMEMNDDDEFLKSLPNKDKIILFANANCAYNCTSRICYSSISKAISGKEKPAISCSKDVLPRDQLGHVFFNVKKLHSFGYTHFKLVPNLSVKKELDEKENTQELLLNIMKKFKSVFYLLSFPKSGRTWLRYILANYINLYYKLNLDINLHTMFNLIPNDSLDTKKGLTSYSFVKDDRFPILIASHNSLKSYTDENKIVLLRNVYDLLVSDYFQHIHFLKKYDGSIKEFIKERNSSLHRYCNFINSLENNANQTIVITYEMMHENIFDVIKELLNYLNMDIDNEILEQSIKYSTFENMKKDELIRGIPDYKGDKNDTNSFRIREGKVNNYDKYLDQEDIEYINQYCQNNLTPYSKELLEKLDINFTIGGLFNG